MKRQFNRSTITFLIVIALGTSIFCVSSASAQSNQPIVYTYNSSSPPHAPASDNFGHSFAYDANGNQTSIVHSTSTTSMSYNHLNKLRSVQNGLAPTVEYRYDNSGTKTAKLIGGVISERYFGSIDIKNGVKTRYYFMGGRRIAERKMDVSGSIQFYQPDHLGSTSLVTNQTGAEVHRADYYEFGAIRKEQGSETKDYAYNDKRREKETDFYDYGARAYAAKFMKFTSPDSIVPEPTESISLNRYAYVNNNPMKYVDPTGHAATPFYQPRLPAGFTLKIEWSLKADYSRDGLIRSSKNVFDSTIYSVSSNGTRTELAKAYGHYDPDAKDLRFNWSDVKESRGKGIYGWFHEQALQKFPATETVTMPVLDDGNLRAWETGGIGNVPKTKIMNNLGFEYIGDGGVNDASYAKLGSEAHDALTELGGELSLSKYFKPTRALDEILGEIPNLIKSGARTAASMAGSIAPVFDGLDVAQGLSNPEQVLGAFDKVVQNEPLFYRVGYFIQNFWSISMAQYQQAHQPIGPKI